MESIAEALSYSFIQHALIAGVFVSILAGIIGSLVVVNRMVFLAGGIAHAAYGGICLAVYFGLPFILTTALFSTSVAILLAFITLKNRHRSDSIIGFVWAIGMAFGVLLIDMAPGYSGDLMSYLFGSILAVREEDIYAMGALVAVTLGILAFYYRDFLAISYDPEFAKLRGVPVKMLFSLMLILTALTVVMAIQVVGLIMVIALLTIPVYIAEEYSKSLAKMMLLSSLLSLLFTTLGLYLSYRFDLTSGASIIAVAALALGIFGLLKYLRARRSF